MGDSMNQPQDLDSPTMLLRRLHRWRMAFFGLIILIAGLTTGAAALLATHWSGPEPVVPPERAPEMMLERIVPRLRLSAEQADRVETILRKHMDRLDEIRQQGRSQIAKELESMDTDMASVLSSDQQRLWRDLLRGLPSQLRRGPGGRSGPGPLGPFGPRGGGPGRGRRSMEGPEPAPNEPPSRH